MPFKDPARRRLTVRDSQRKRHAAMTEEEKEAVRVKANARARERYRDEEYEE